MIFVLANAPTSNGQYYQKLLKGQPSPFDTAVAIHIDRYRDESLQLNLHQQLVDSLVREIFSLNLEIRTGNEQFMINEELIRTLDARDLRQDSVNRVFKQSIDKMATTIENTSKPIGPTEYGLAAVFLLLLFDILFN